jgi:ribose transport system ATP-binding protein
MERVAKAFGATRALTGVDLDLRSGEVLGLVGENGAGKSTLVNILAGIVAPDAGAMWLDGRPYAPKGPLDARRAGVAMIHQELTIAPHLTIAENVSLGEEPGWGPFLDWRAMRARARRALETVGLAHLPVDRTAGSLSAAERQLVEIGRAVDGGCRILVLDEPTSSLTREDAARLFSIVARLREEGAAIVYISHFLEEVRAVTDRFTVLRDGASVGEGRTRSVETADLAALMVGRALTDLYPRSLRPRGEVLLEIEGMGGERLPRSASLRLHRGEVVGIAGLVGAGRTELLRAVFGLDPVRRGRVRIGSFEGPATPALRWARGAGMVSEDRKSEGLALGLSVADNLVLPALPWRVSPPREERHARAWIERLDIRCSSPRQAVGELSGGNQQKAALGRLLHSGADLLLLDEPTRGIDIGAKALVYRWIDQLALSGRAVLVVSSHLPELLGVCDRIAVMCRGVLGAARPVAETGEHRIMLEATGCEPPHSRDR